MKDEISRLREMRQMALKTKAMARVLDHSSRRDSVQARAALHCWRLARIATGRLRAQPYESYQRAPSRLILLHPVIAGLLAAQRGRGMGALSRQLQSLCRVLDDTRALTLSPDLSDALGRAQVYLRPLMAEIAVKARLEMGPRPVSDAAAADVIERSAAPVTSPYLAL